MFIFIFHRQDIYKIRVKVHLMQLDHIWFAKSPFYFWPIIRFSVFPTQFWIFTEVEGDGIESRVPYKIFSTLMHNIKVHIMQLDHIRFAKSSFYFWPIIRFSVFPAQFWIFSKWCLVLSLGTLFTEIRQILAKFIFF